MPNLKKNPSALKAMRRDARKSVYRGAVRSSTRTAVKKARLALAGAKGMDTQESVLEAIQALDKAAAKGIIHKNAAARRKSRLMAAYNKTQQTSA